MAYESGIPWQQQYGNNRSQFRNITDWTLLSAQVPVNMTSVKALVACGYVFLFGVPGAATTYYRAPMNADGTVGSWTSHSLDALLASYTPEVLLVGRRVFLLGDGTQSVHYATVRNDGTFSTWTTLDTALPDSRRGGRAIIIERRIYYIGGGSADDSAETNVYYSDLDAADIPGSAWYSSANTLTSGRRDGMLVYTGSKLYYFGGCGASLVSLSTGFVATVTGNVIGSWSAAPYSLPAANKKAQVAVSGDTAYIIGGYINTSTPDVLSTVSYTNISAAGSLGAWSVGGTLPSNAERYGGDAIITSSKVYLIGGSNDSGATTYLVSASFAGGMNDYAPAISWLFKT